MAVVVVGIFYYVNEINIPNANPEGEKEFVIESGQGVEEIAEGLKEQGFIKNAFIFRLYVELNSFRSEFRDGKYVLPTDLTIKEIVSKLIKVENLDFKERQLTFIEGWRSDQMDEYLVKEGFIEPGELLEYIANYDSGKWTFLSDKPEEANLEGYLFPDTYRVYADATLEDIVEKMLANFDRKVTDELRQEIKRQDKTIYEVLTLASIVEREMFGIEDRKIVAGIFQNRLDIGMALQTDASITFITKKKDPRPTLDDLQIISPYNTYKNPGLPPGPISNPGIEAIKATIYPEDTNYFYFLTTDDGQIYYSVTHDQHVANKQKYLK